MNLIEKFGKKKIFITGGAIIIALIAIGIGIWYTSEQNHKQKVLDALDITFKENEYIEYGETKVDFNSFIKDKKGEPEITLPTDKVDTKKLGKKEFIYKISKDGYSKEKSLSIEIKDTKAPAITFKEDKVTLECGAEFDAKSNIKSVNDPVDGKISYEANTKDNNYYTIASDVDTSAAGDYTVTVKAVDKNKLASEKKYVVHVNEKTEEPVVNSSDTDDYTPPTNNEGGSTNNYTPPTNSGGNNSGVNNQTNPTPPPTACKANGQWKSLGNSGYADYDYNAVLQWGKDNCPENHRVVVATVHDICGNEGYSVGFYPLSQ